MALGAVTKVWVAVPINAAAAEVVDARPGQETELDAVMTVVPEMSTGEEVTAALGGDMAGAGTARE